MTEKLDPTYCQLMKDALKANENHQIGRLGECCRAMIPLIPDPTPESGDKAAGFFKALRAERRYDHLQMMAEAYVKAEYLTPRLQTIYAQALIDRGNQVAAIGLLTSLLGAKEEKETRDELPEIYGLLGRAWKDIGWEALNTGRKSVADRALRQSHKFYALGLATNPTKLSLLVWQGTQRAAVAIFANANGLGADLPDERQFAEQILSAIGKTSPDERSADPWLLLGAGEMAVALGRFVEALAWYEKAVGKERTDSFMLAGSHRQLSQIWRIGEAGPDAKKVEELLVGAIAHKGGRFLLSGGEAVQLQARIEEGVDYVGRASVQQALRCARSVAMIMKRFKPLGTGFVVNAAALGLAEPGKVVVTNAHVVSDPPQYDAAVPRDVQVKFELHSADTIFRVERIVACLSVEGHDCTVLKLEEDVPVEALPLGELPMSLSGDRTACVIGHPLGQEISFSFRGSELVGFEPFAGVKPQRLHYRSPTDRGHSGSPVFNESWRVIGLHHAYKANAPALNGTAGTYAANEGISMASIKAALSAGTGAT
jgi:tetratricopeptide (TPR) repeat protein